MKKRTTAILNLRRLRAKYRLALQKKKSILLDEFCDLTGMHRKSLIRLLNKDPRKPKKRKGPVPIYNPKELLPILKGIWFASDQMCSKKLKVVMPIWLPFYEKEHGELSGKIRKRLLNISAATIDRLFRSVKVYCYKGRNGTKPGSLLKNQIPIKTNHWDDKQAGFLEADSVAHCGNSLQGDFVWSLTFTDIHTTWTENRAIWNKGATGVVEQTKDVERVLPFKIKGFDCDNGSEFLNYHLIRYFCDRPKARMVQFTRSRPYHKNDNAHVEQKNWTHVRQLFGYDRFGHPKLIGLMNDLYKNEWSLYQNHFIPTMKCIKKEKINSKYRKCYDVPKTPYERVLNCDEVTKKKKQQLKNIHNQLNPFELKRKIEKKLKRIFQYVNVNDKVRRRI